MQISKDIAAVSRFLRRQRNRYMAPLGLKGLHARLLLDILENPGISQDGLAQKTGFDKSNIARQVAVLEEAGFVERRSCSKDKRMIRLYPTEKTLALQDRIVDAMESWQQHLLQDLSQEEQATLEELLERIRLRASEEG